MNTLGTNLWRYHSDPDQLIGHNRVQLRTLVGYYSGELDADEFPDELRYARNQDPVLKKALSSDTDDVDVAIFYAIYIAGTRLLDLERKILSHYEGTLQHREPLKLDYQYQSLAKYVERFFNGHWPELEKQMIERLKLNPSFENVYDALLYMYQVNLKSWPDLAEILLELPEDTLDELKEKNRYLIKYAKQSGERWPDAENTIARQGWAIVTYCRDAIGKPWPEAEPIILKTNYVTSYLSAFPDRKYALERLGYRKSTYQRND